MTIIICFVVFLKTLIITDADKDGADHPKDGTVQPTDEADEPADETQKPIVRNTPKSPGKRQTH